MKILLCCCCAVLALALTTGAQPPTTDTTRAGAPPRGGQQTRAVGEVTAVEAPGRQLKIKTEDGRVLTIRLDDATTLRRVPPGAARADEAAPITLAEVKVGERVFARGELSADGLSFAARQMMVSQTAAAAAVGANERGGRGLFGRITALKPETKEIAVLARTPDGGRQVMVVASSPQVRFKRIAPDSLSAQDAVPSSFAALQVGDQLRASGERSADGARFTAEEIVSGSLLRIGGTVAAVNASTGELTINAQPNGQQFIVRTGARSQLRRITPEAAASFERARASAGTRPPPGEVRAPDNRSASTRRTGQTMQELYRGLPVITVNDLKAGDAVLITGTPGADATHLTAISLLTGEAEFIGRLQRLGSDNGANMSPGLPGSVLGGGIPMGERDPREPPP